MKRNRNWPANTSAWRCSTSRPCSIAWISELGSGRSVEALGIQLGSAVGAEAGTDPGIGIFLDVNLHAAPKAFRAQNPFASHANRQQPVQAFHFGEGRLQLLDQPLALFRGELALVEQAPLPDQSPHRQRQPTKSVLEDVIPGAFVDD